MSSETRQFWSEVKKVILDGNGRPQDAKTKDGDVLILVQGRRVSVVRLNLLPEDQFGPELEHALNGPELESEVFRLVLDHDPTFLNGERHFTLRCPMRIARRARFRADA